MMRLVGAFKVFLLPLAFSLLFDFKKPQKAYPSQRGLIPLFFYIYLTKLLCYACVNFFFGERIAFTFGFTYGLYKQDEEAIPESE